jgi:hypothetical protein
VGLVNDLHPRIAAPFPTPPGAVLRALQLLQILRRGDPDEIAAAGDLSNLPRPWDPPTCPDELREAVWEWCDLVAAWLNHEYAWRPTRMIPPCWPHHAHIARELAVLAILRWNAEESTTPEPVEEWHRYTFPMFCDRMTNRLGESACRTAKHIDWPAEGRYAAFVGDESSGERQQVIYADTRPVTHLHKARRA